MKKLAWLAAIIVAALLVIDCGGAGGGNTIKIGMIYNMTGSQASLDAPSANGAKLAAKEINAAGGVLGKKMTLVAYDGKSDAATIANAATQLTQSDKVVAMFGFSDSDMVMAAAPVAAKAGIVFVTSGATSPKLPDQVPDYLYLACFGDNVQAAAGAEYAFSGLEGEERVPAHRQGHGVHAAPGQVLQGAVHRAGRHHRAGGHLPGRGQGLLRADHEAEGAEDKRRTCSTSPRGRMTWAPS